MIYDSFQSGEFVKVIAAYIVVEQINDIIVQFDRRFVTIDQIVELYL
jgi:hypothetical protein